MRPKAILFDMDGTLLPMDQNVFMKQYFGEMAKVLSPLGLAPEAVAPTIWAGTKAMMKNTGELTNDKVFWQVFTQVSGLDAAPFRPAADAFYSNQFHRARAATAENPLAVEAVRVAREKAQKVVLATNPLFPAIATHSRVRWAGLEPEDFSFITTYENSSFCKPNPAYYREILDRLGLDPAECVMVGNDADEDGAVRARGLPVFLLTDCLIQKPDADVSGLELGDFDRLCQWLGNL